MKKPIKKTALFMILFGTIIFAISGFFGLKEYQIISTGQEVNATVSAIIQTNGKNGINYRPEFSYRHKNQNQKYLRNYTSSSNNYVVGDPEVLIVSDKGVTIKGITVGIIAIAIGIIFGLLFLIIGTVWNYRYRKHFDEIARIKKIGKRVQARFIKKESLPQNINGQHGIVLFFQQEKSERIFQTKPIFSEFSIHWLEEHSFDVYLDPKNDTKYFVDIEKHFGHPQKQN